MFLNFPKRRTETTRWYKSYSIRTLRNSFPITDVKQWSRWWLVSQCLMNNCQNSMLVKQPVSTLLMLEDLTNSHKYQFMIYLREFAKSWNIRIINNWGINCLSFEPTIPSKFMVRTDTNQSRHLRLEPSKRASEDLVFGNLLSHLIFLELHRTKYYQNTKAFQLHK